MSDAIPDQAGPARPSRKARRPYSRSSHRDRAHDSAHAESGPAPADHPALPLVPPGEADVIVTDAALADLIALLRDDGSFAYDSEFIGELTYHPKLCVIQAASPRRVALIDPLASIDLSPFWDLLCDPAVEKIVHAGQQDIEPVVRHLGRAPANVFDTQIAAGLAALPYPVSLSKLTLELTGVKLGKGATFTHWDRRPLSAMQLRYAADDVRFLPFIRDVLGRRLAELGHVQWADEECAAQCDPARHRFDPETQYERVRGCGTLDPRNLAVLKALVQWRDESARQADLPPRAFLRDEVLLDLARNPARTTEHLDRVRGLPRPVESAHGGRIVELTLHALALPAPRLPAGRDVEPSPTDRFRSDAVWAAAQAICAGQGIDPALVASRQEIGDFWRRMESGAAPEDHRIMSGWRRQALGEPLTALMNGSRPIHLRSHAGQLRADFGRN